MYEVLSIGEALMDFIPLSPGNPGSQPMENTEGAEDQIPEETQQDGAPVFEQSVGGSPANVACALARLGVKPALLEKSEMMRWGSG